MNISDFKLNRTFFVNTEKYFEKIYGADYYNNKWPIYYPDIVLNNSFWYPANPVIKWMHDSALDSKISFREFMIKYSEFLFEINLNSNHIFPGKFSDIKQLLEESIEYGKYYSNWADLKITKNIVGYFTAEVTVPSIFHEFYLFGIEGVFSNLLKKCNNKIHDYKSDYCKSFFVDGIEFINVRIDIKYE